MTQPTLLAIVREGLDNRPKIFLRTLLFCTAARGCVIQSMYLRVHPPIGSFIFDLWGYGDRENIVLGSGLFIGPAGTSLNHHFLLRRVIGEDSIFWYGEYRVEIFANILGRGTIKLQELKLTVGSLEAAAMVQISDVALYFEWRSDTNEYVARVDRQPDAMTRGNWSHDSR